MDTHQDLVQLNKDLKFDQRYNDSDRSIATLQTTGAYPQAALLKYKHEEVARQRDIAPNIGPRANPNDN